MYYNFGSNAQYLAQDSVYWVRIVNSKSTAKLFEYKGINDSTLVGCIQKNALQGNSIFFLESNDIADKSPKYPSLMRFPNIDSLTLSECVTEYTYFPKDNRSIIFAYNKHLPLIDASVEVIIVIDVLTGTQFFINAPETITLTPIKHLSEMRIKIERQFNKTTNDFEFVPAAVQLLPQAISKMNYSIWLDLYKLKQNTPAIENQEWYKRISEIVIKGEKYMQTTTTLQVR